TSSYGSSARVFSTPATYHTATASSSITSISTYTSATSASTATTSGVTSTASAGMLVATSVSSAGKGDGMASSAAAIVSLPPNASIRSSIRSNAALNVARGPADEICPQPA